MEQLRLPNHVVSRLSAGRAVITGRRQRNPDWGKSGDAQTAGLPPLDPQHNHNANQPIVSLEAMGVGGFRISATDTRSQGRGGRGHRQ